jgi:predicted RNA-binding protein with PIN domain
LRDQSNALFFIDAYNLLYKLDGIDQYIEQDHSAARTLLYREFKNLAGINVNQIKLVIDGGRLTDEEPLPGMSVIWVSLPEKADDRIIKLLLREAKKGRSHRPFVVVSDDVDLRKKAAARGAQLISCREFIQSYIEPAKKAAKAGTSKKYTGAGRIRKSGGVGSKQELDWWLNEMGAEADPLLNEEESAANDIQEPAKPDSTDENAKKEKTHRKKGKKDDLARMLGLDPDDPRIYTDDDEL